MKLDRNSYLDIFVISCVLISLIIITLLFLPIRPLAYTITGLLVFINCFIIFFHRVPNRNVVGNEKVVSSVADGKVVIVEKAFEKEYLKRECIQVSIYMDFFDVHANFWPMTGEVTYYKYHPGKYLLAFSPKASEENEHSSTCLKNQYGEVFFKQIAGTFARRIVCYSKEGNQVKAGDQCGIIKFGSRIDMFFPLDADIKVKVGEYTRASETIIATLS